MVSKAHTSFWDTSLKERRTKDVNNIVCFLYYKWYTGSAADLPTTFLEIDERKTFILQYVLYPKGRSEQKYPGEELKIHYTLDLRILHCTLKWLLPWRWFDDDCQAAPNMGNLAFWLLDKKMNGLTFPLLNFYNSININLFPTTGMILFLYACIFINDNAGKLVMFSLNL